MQLSRLLSGDLSLLSSELKHDDRISRKMDSVNIVSHVFVLWDVHYDAAWSL